MMRRLLLILMLCTLGCGLGRPVVITAPAYQPPSWRERQLALRQTWETLVAERTTRARRAALDQAQEDEEDAFRQLPIVSLTTGSQSTLAEAMAVLLADLPFTVVYGPYVEPTNALSTYISHQRLDRAMATLVHPLGYQVTLDPTWREIHIEAMTTRHWAVPPRPATDTQFWTQLGDALRALVRGDTNASPAPGYVVINPDAGDVTVSARVPRMPMIEAHMRPLAVTTGEEDAWTQ
jgi:hypothetical protein